MTQKHYSMMVKDNKFADYSRNDYVKHLQKSKYLTIDTTMQKEKLLSSIYSKKFQTVIDDA